MNFLQLCTCSPAQYATLKQRIDFCARQGRSYEFSPCTLPQHCQPAQGSVGFWTQNGDYLLYFRPSVTYLGRCEAFRAFFDRGSVQRFSSFEELARMLGALTPQSRESTPDRLKTILARTLLGQEEALEAVTFKLCAHICKPSPMRPLSLIFYGPTGVGKSELGKAIAPGLNELLGEDRYVLVWTELNTFTQAHSVYRLTGAPPGYAGYGDPPVLEAVRRNPWTVFMFDELDKAHPEVLKIFMSILDEGRCSAQREDPSGNRELDFRRCIFLFTTNSDLTASQPRPLGFSLPPEEAEAQKAAQPPGTTGLARRLFLADETARLALKRSGVLGEIAGRFSGFIGFHPLSREAKTLVTAKQIASLGREYGLEIVQVAPLLAQAFTPKDALSPRSTAAVLEGALTPLFLRESRRASGRLKLAGTPEAMELLPS